MEDDEWVITIIHFLAQDLHCKMTNVICCNRDFAGKEKCFFFPDIGISTPFAAFSFERTTLRLSWVVFELENVAVHGKITGKIDRKVVYASVC